VPGPWPGARWLTGWSLSHLRRTEARKPPHESGLGYRPEVDGLRAIAVLSVVLYHAGWSQLGGGYVGVDVFFVISGFLITSLIRKEAEAGAFSLVGFYERRARRILPALFAVVTATAAAGVIILMPAELEDLGASMVGAATFASNILFWRQTDYFSPAIDLKPLVHTWSLAVEEQFYILFPLMLVAIVRWGGKRYAAPVLLLAALSFGASVALLRLEPTADYYLLPTRAWELLMGSVVALGFMPALRSRFAAEAVSLLGLAAIVGSALLLKPDSPFPGWNALWPCLGAAAFIHANSGTATMGGRLMSLRPVVAIGLISYSLYLIHWPVLIFLRYVLLRPPTLLELAVAFIAMLALAALSWRFVEQPFRNRARVSRRTIFASSGAGLVLCAVIGLGLYKSDGLPQRFPDVDPTEAVIEDPNPAGQRCFLEKGFDEWGGEKCFIARGAGPVVLYWGDSHAHHYRQAIEEASPPIDANILLYSSAGCLPVLGADADGLPDCRPNNDHALEIIKQYKVSTVILGGWWNPTLEDNGLTVADVAATIARLRAMGLKVRIIGDNPDYTFANPQFLGHRLRARRNAAAAVYLPSRTDERVNAALARLVDEGDFFDPMAGLCRAGKCLVYDEGEVMMVDASHFSLYGAKRVVNRMRSFLEGRPTPPAGRGGSAVAGL